MQSISPRAAWGSVALFGVAAVALGVLALIGIVPRTLAAAAVVVLGVADLVPEEAFGRPPSIGLWGFRAIVGVAAIALGVLGLIGIAPTTLVAAGIIVLGVDDFLPVGMLSGARGNLEWGVRALIGAAAAALGVLALIGIIPTTLIAIGVIVLGVDDFIP